MRVTRETQHIPIDKLADLVEGRLDPDAEVAVQTHVAGCAKCARALEWLRRVVELMRGDDREEPPPRVAAAITRAFAERRRRRSTAVLRFDSALTPAAGTRGAAARERQLVFLAGEVALDLRVVAAGPAYKVAGQVIGAPAGGRVVLESAATSASAEISELGEFALPPVPEGSYTLMLQLATLEIEIATLEIGAST
jgi:anti-sigma factor RsiW